MPRSKPELEAALDLDAIRKLPVYKAGTTRRFGSPGMGCYGDPPGYPTYYMRPVYDLTGNTPEGAPDSIIVLDGTAYIVNHPDDYKKAPVEPTVHSWDAVVALREQRYQSLYKPLPFEHPRVRAWVLATMGHHGTHYYHPTEKDKFARGPKSIFYPASPTPYMDEGWQFETKPVVFKDDPRFNDEWREAERKAVEARNTAIAFENAAKRIANEAILERMKGIAVVANHVGVIIIRRQYPDVPDSYFEDLIANPRRSVGSWYTTSPTQPTPEQCGGDESLGATAHHPQNGNWCQWCGWHAPKDDETIILTPVK